MNSENKENYLIVSIDVEEDMPNWVIEEETTVRNLEGIPPLQAIFEKFGIRATYLLNYPYATNKEAVSYFSGIKEKCEIGSHMHPWNTPPLEKGEDKQIEYPSNLSYEKQYEKVKAVTEVLTEAFGKPPTSYRSGKFGFNQDTRKILASLGYIVDSSITPMVSWEAQNGPSFLDYRVDPFWWNDGGDKLFEVPVTIGLTRNLSFFLEKMFLSLPRFTRLRGILSKDYLNVVDLVWLYPALFSGEEMVKLSETMLQKEVRVFNMFFHSSEIKTGESIYTNSKDDLNRYYERLEYFFDFAINKQKMKSVTLTEFAHCST